MGINKQSDLEANLQIGPTDRGMVRIYVVGSSLGSRILSKFNGLSDSHIPTSY